jgi:hypothetical protein
VDENIKDYFSARAMFGLRSFVLRGRIPIAKSKGRKKNAKRKTSKATKDENGRTPGVMRTRPVPRS